jgi:hypothetical protein
MVVATPPSGELRSDSNGSRARRERLNGGPPPFLRLTSAAPQTLAPGSGERRASVTIHETWHLEAMAIPNAAAERLALTMQAALEDELRRAEQDFAQGDVIELTVEDLGRCIAAGEWPWATASSE